MERPFSAAFMEFIESQMSGFPTQVSGLNQFSIDGFVRVRPNKCLVQQNPSTKGEFLAEHSDGKTAVGLSH